MGRVARGLELLRAEAGTATLQLVLAQGLCRLLPPYVGVRLRPRLLRAAGLRLGRGTTIWGALVLGGAHDPATMLSIGEECSINGGCTFDLAAPVRIGHNVSFGHDVLIVTAGHRIGPPGRRAGELEPAPVTIADGVWLGARSVVLPGVTIGAGSVVAAGAVVTRDVPPDVLVAGVPARVVRRYDVASHPIAGQ